MGTIGRRVLRGPYGTLKWKIKEACLQPGQPGSDHFNPSRGGVGVVAVGVQTRWDGLGATQAVGSRANLWPQVLELVVGAE